MKTTKIPGQCYLVGGAVRDQILGLPIKERDYVVIDATPEQMTEAGFIPVGKDFPVFLHPQTHEEYALARTERKITKGHQGFNFYTDPSVTLEQDLQRRDLSINAIAAKEDGSLIDPYHGQDDIKAKLLRHVSPAFSEDPLRIFRAARFRAYLGQFNFNIAKETLNLMKTMIEEHAADELSDERIWQELEKALNTSHPELFFQTLKELNALNNILPKLSSKGIEALISAKKISSNPVILFASLCFEGPYLKKLPKDFADLQQLTQKHYQDFDQYQKLTKDQQLKFLHAQDFLRRPERTQNFLSSALIITKNQENYDLIEEKLKALKSIDRAKIAKEAQQQNLNIKEHINKIEFESINTNSTLK